MSTQNSGNEKGLLEYLSGFHSCELIEEGHAGPYWPSFEQLFHEFLHEERENGKFYLLKSFEELWTDLVSSSLDVRRGRVGNLGSVKHFQTEMSSTHRIIREHDGRGPVALPTHPIDDTLLFFPRLFIDGNRSYGGRVLFEAVTV